MLPKGDSLQKRSILNFFSRTELTIVLCIILAAESIVGSLLYRGDTAFEGGRGFSIFSSPLYLVPALLLVANIATCVLKRVMAGKVKGRIPLVLAHAFLILAISGMIIDGRFGNIYTGYFSFRVPSGTVFDWRSGQDHALPFQIEVSEYREVRYPYLLKVGIRKNPGGEKVGLFVVKEGDSLEVPGGGLILRNIRFDPGTSEISFQGFYRGEELGIFHAGKEGSLPLGGKYIAVPVAFRDFGLKNMIATLKVKDRGTLSEYDVSPNNPAVHGGLNITLIESRLDKYRNLFVGFQMTETPGEPVFWVGTVGFFSFILIHLVMGRRK